MFEQGQIGASLEFLSDQADRVILNSQIREKFADITNVRGLSRMYATAPISFIVEDQQQLVVKTLETGADQLEIGKATELDEKS